jgi:hypothetical protein
VYHCTESRLHTMMHSKDSRLCAVMHSIEKTPRYVAIKFWLEFHTEMHSKELQIKLFIKLRAMHHCAELRLNAMHPCTVSRLRAMHHGADSRLHIMMHSTELFGTAWSRNINVSAFITAIKATV